MGEERWCYGSAEEWRAIVERLRLTPCPHCQAVGALVQHGFLYGFDDGSPQRKTVRARRIFCSNRQARRGCGRAISVWPAEKIERLCVTASGLWRFLQSAATSGVVAAFRTATSQLSDRTWLRIWKRFDRAQCQIRTALSGRCPPPELPAERRPAAQIIAHLEVAFPAADSPIAAFQQTLRASFM